MRVYLEAREIVDISKEAEFIRADITDKSDKELRQLRWILRLL